MHTTTTILLVEDNIDNVSIYTAFLEFSGFKVLSATNGATGVAMARASMPDLILMDVSLPGVDGWEATRQLKSDPATHFIPIIVLTAHAFEADRARAFAEGADDFIAKPADPRNVIASIRSVLAKAGGAS